MVELWRSVPGHVGYEVSDLGRIRSYWGRGTQGLVNSPKIMTPVRRAQGYYWVNLGRGAQQALHRLVAAAFIGPMPTGLECRHLDGNKLNCAVTNLAYGTRSENYRDRERHGTSNRGRYAEFPGSLTPAGVHRIRTTRISGTVLAEELGVSTHTIYAARNRKTWKLLP